MEALELHRRTGNWQRGSAILNNVAQIHGRLGEWPIAQEYLRQAIEMALKAGNPHHTAALLANLGDIHDAAGEPAEARDAWRRAAEIAETLEYAPNSRDAFDAITRLRHTSIGPAGAGASAPAPGSAPQNTDSIGPRRK
jgi:tetratricopeptide (TPR) repeat protein